MGQQGTRRGLLIVLSGPSGAGKNTLLNAYMADHEGVRYSISATTRPPRPGEVEGVDYYFVSPQRFQEMIAADELLEWANFCGHLYGTPKEAVEKALDRGVDIILDIDTQGAKQLKRKMPHGVFIFLLPPSMGELRKRIRGRGTETEEQIASRLAKALSEFSEISEYDYYIIHDQTDRAVQMLSSIVMGETARVRRIDPLSLIQDILGAEEAEGS